MVRSVLESRGSGARKREGWSQSDGQTWRGRRPARMNPRRSTCKRSHNEPLVGRPGPAAGRSAYSNSSAWRDGLRARRRSGADAPVAAGAITDWAESGSGFAISLGEEFIKGHCVNGHFTAGIGASKPSIDDTGTIAFIVGDQTKLSTARGWRLNLRPPMLSEPVFCVFAVESSADRPGLASRPGFASLAAAVLSGGSFCGGAGCVARGCAGSALGGTGAGAGGATVGVPGLTGAVW